MAQKHRNHTVKKHRNHTVKKHCRCKKRNGGMPSSKKSKPNPKPNPYAMVLYRPPGGMDHTLRLSALSSPNWGIGKKLRYKLFNRPSAFPPFRRGVDESMSATMSSVVTEGLANDLYERAERLRATSFRSQNVDECRQKNQDAVELLKQAIVFGSLKARACLADMLFNGATVGIDINWPEAMLLLGDVANMDPDCEGVLAHHRFKREYHIHDRQEHIRAAAEHSAAAGSKYGQCVVGLIALETNLPDLASQQFNLAAQQNYDQAQIKLGELCLRATPPDEDEALRLFELAAEQGNMHAFQLIANMHKKNALEPGAHEPASCMEAVKWFTFRKQAGCLIAQNDLAELKPKCQHD
jgi:TPR repeat protein